MKTLLLPLLALLAVPAFAVRTAEIVSSASLASYVKAGNEQSPSLVAVFDTITTNNIVGAKTGSAIVLDFTGFVTEAKPRVCVTTIDVTSTGAGTYSLFTSEDGSTWNPVSAAQHVQTTGTKTYPIGIRVLYVKYVFDSTSGADLRELTVWGWKSTKPENISKGKVARSITFRDGAGHRGNYGFNGGSYSSGMFDNNFTSGLYQNGAGCELVFPTTAFDSNGNDTGVPMYVTEVKVGHLGNSKYSLYYTTEPEPADILTHDKDPRAWILIPGADHVQEAGTKTYIVNKTVTAAKYVFDTAPSWTQAACEFAIWAMDADDLPCTHDNFDPDTATWTICTPATCTENAFEESFCPDCGLRFEREVPLSKLGHDFVATLTRAGRHDRWGSGYVTCARTIQDTNTLEVIWSCDFRIDFDGEDVDLTTLGGPPINGVVQYTDLYASSLGAEDGGIKPVYMMDGFWDNGWGHAYYFAECNVNEYAQYVFGTKIELTKIEYSVINESQTVYFSRYDPDTGEETPLKTIPIAKDETTMVEKKDKDGKVETDENGDVIYVNIGYQRFTIDFFVTDKSKKTFVDAIRMRIGDYVDPVTGAVTRYRGYNYGANDRHTIICEFHPWGTIEGAGPLTHNPTTIMLLR